MKSIRLKKPNKWRSIIVTLLFVITLLPQCLPSVSAAETTAQQIITVKQTVDGKPEKTSYVYAVVQTHGPDMDNNITERSFKLTGNDTHETKLKFTEPGTYEFTIGRVVNETKNASEITLDDFYKDDNVVPIKHPFGYKVTQNEDGSLEVLPYTCYDNHVEFLKDGTGIVLMNTIKGAAEPTPTPTPSATVTPTPKPSSGTGTSDNGKGQYTPKTGDEFHMRLWVSLAVGSILLLLLLLLLGRKKKKEEKS